MAGGLVGLAAQPAHAAANFHKAIKVGSGWVTVLSYINTMAPPAAGSVSVYATYQVKNLANLTDPCLHLDSPSVTTRNDLTTTVLSTPGGAVGSVYPATDTVGGAIINPPVVPGAPVSEGFLVLENIDNAGAGGADGTLTSEAIVFNTASGFLYSGRALTVTQLVPSPGGNVDIDAPGCGNCNYLHAIGGNSNTSVGGLSRFMFLPAATATTGAYVVALNLAGLTEGVQNANTRNLVTGGYGARIRLEARMDLAQGYNPGIYNRLEQYRSLVDVNDVVCAAQLTPAQLTGGLVPGFIVDGGWMNLKPICREDIGGGVIQSCDASGTGTELGDAAIIHKVEFATGYGYAVTPQHQQWYTK